MILISKIRFKPDQFRKKEKSGEGEQAGTEMKDEDDGRIWRLRHEIYLEGDLSGQTTNNKKRQSVASRRQNKKDKQMLSRSRSNTTDEDDNNNNNMKSDYDEFLQELDGDAEMRRQVNLFKKL